MRKMRVMHRLRKMQMMRVMQGMQVGVQQSSQCTQVWSHLGNALECSQCTRVCSHLGNAPKTTAPSSAPPSTALPSSALPLPKMQLHTCTCCMMLSKTGVRKSRECDNGSYLHMHNTLQCLVISIWREHDNQTRHCSF